MADGVTYQASTLATPPDATKVASVELASSEGHAERVVPGGANTATTTAVNDTASNATLLASNADRIGATFYNDSTQVCYVKYGTTASLSSFHVAMSPGGYLEIPFFYRGNIDGIWAADGSGAMRICEFT